MGRVFELIDADLSNWISQQKMFFVATAPLSGDGLINCSPKGLDTLRVLGPNSVAYLDLHGSGVETIAHLRENGRIVIMLCALTGPPRIVRIYGRGQVCPAGSERFLKLAVMFPEIPGARSLIEIDVMRISDSCGFGVPLFEFQTERSALVDWAAKKGDDGLREYRQKNQTSIDGLPGDCEA
jgi:hypothetical protein